MKKKNTIQSTESAAIRTFYMLVPVMSILLLIVIWFLAADDSSMFGFPSPIKVYERYISFRKTPIMKISLAGHILASLSRVMIGLVFSWIIGISLGIALGWSKKINSLIGPIFNAFRAVPPLAWIPLITIWFGIGEFPKVLVIFIGAIMPVVVNTQAGIQNVDKTYLDIGTIFNANARQRLFQIAIPSALDAIFAGIRTSASAAWMVVLAAEMLGAKSGIGFLIIQGMGAGDLSLILLAMICIAVVGALIAVVTEKAERMLCPWTRV